MESYLGKSPCAERAVIEGGKSSTPTSTLTASKETYRDQDRVDVVRLSELLGENPAVERGLQSKEPSAAIQAPDDQRVRGNECGATIMTSHKGASR